MKPFVLVHGAWVGGWYLREIARVLRAAGYEVFTPTLTGLGERVHLGHREVGLDTHVQDIVNVLIYEDLWEVTLVGHSYGGMVITGVAEVVPERIGHLIYLDALVPKNGQSAANHRQSRCRPVATHLCAIYGKFISIRARLRPDRAKRPSRRVALSRTGG